MKTQNIHGGDIYRNEVELDFSVNINPYGIPKRIKKALRNAIADCVCYPDVVSEELRNAIGKMTAADPETILCGNGASELFLAIVHAVKPKTVFLAVPSFLGYEKAAKATGGRIVYHIMREADGFCLKSDVLDALTEEVELLFLANPNNPVGNTLPCEFLEQILIRCRRKQIYVVLDECFIELAGKEEQSFLGRIREFPNLMVVRAFTKSFAIPGVRLGYLVCGNEMLLEKIRMQIPEWNVSGFAQQAGTAAAQERAFLEESVKRIAKERAFLAAGLRKNGFRVFQSDANYLMFQAPENLKERLLEQKILIRDCSNYPGLEKGVFRVAVKKRKENKRLLAAIREITDND